MALLVAVAVCALGALSTSALAAGQFLVYTGNGGVSEGFTKFASATGRTLVTDSTLPADLSANACVILPINQVAFDPAQVAILASYLAAGGKVLALAEYSGFLGNQLSVMNGLSASLGTGLTLNFDTADIDYNITSVIPPGNFTSGVATVGMAATATLQAVPPTAEVIAGTPTGGKPFIAARPIGNGVFVLSGDSNIFSDNSATFYANAGNGRLAKNLCGNVRPPAITIATPASGARYAVGEEVHASYSCVDPDGPDDLASCAGPIASGAQLDTSISGTYTFTVNAVDKAGNASSKAVTYTVDGQPPTVTLTRPAEGAVYERGSPLTAAWSCVDPGPGSAIASTSATLPNGATVPTGTLGPATFTVTCIDLVGNTASAVAHYTIVDTTPPAITFVTPPEGGRYRPAQTVVANWSCTDPGSGSITSQSGTVASGSPADTAAALPGTTTPKSFVVSCTDASGNTSSVTHNYVVDDEPPVVTIASPAGIYDRGASVSVAWACTDPNGGSVASQTAPVPAGGRLDTSKPGQYTFTVTCVDSVGNAASGTTTYTIADASPPSIVIAVPKDGAAFTLGQKITASFACLDADGPDDIATCAPESGPSTVDTSKPGTFQFVVVSSDKAGNRARKSVSYTVTGPAAAAAPTSAAGKRVCTSRRSFRIRVKRKRGVRIVAATVTVNGKRVKTTRGKRVTAVVTLRGLKKGRYRVVIRVRLSDGRTVTDVRRFRTCTPKSKSSTSS